jgi:hypothetical protein
VAATGRNLHELRAALAVRSRAAFLKFLKDEQLLARLSDRQALTNGLTAELRAGRVPSPSLAEIRAVLPSRPATVSIPSGCRCRVFAVADVRADYPFNNEALADAVRTCDIGVGDVCVCCGAAWSDLIGLHAALSLLAAAFGAVIFVPCAGDVLPPPAAASSAWERRRPKATLHPAPALPRDAHQSLHAVLSVCKALHVHTATLHVVRDETHLATIHPLHVVRLPSASADHAHDEYFEGGVLPAPEGSGAAVALASCDAAYTASCDAACHASCTAACHASSNGSDVALRLTCSAEPPDARAGPLMQWMAQLRPAVHVSGASRK